MISIEQQHLQSDDSEENEEKFLVKRNAFPTIDLSFSIRYSDADRLGAMRLAWSTSSALLCSALLSDVPLSTIQIDLTDRQESLSHFAFQIVFSPICSSNVDYFLIMTIEEIFYPMTNISLKRSSMC